MNFLEKYFYLCLMEQKQKTSKIFVIRITQSLKSTVTSFQASRHLNFSAWFSSVIRANMVEIGLLDEYFRPVKTALTPKDETDRRHSTRNSGQEASQGIYIDKVLLDTLRTYADSKECSAANLSELLRIWLEAEMKEQAPVATPVNRFNRKRQIAAA